MNDAHDDDLHQDDVTEDTAADEPTQGETDDGDPEGADQLGDAGKRALDSMKDKWKAERDKRRELERQIAAKADTSDAETLVRDAEQAALAKANARILRSEVKAAAAGKLADPRDALKLLDLDQFEVGDDGEVDEAEIAEAIDDLLKTKPYLAAQQSGRPRFQGTADQGARKRPPARTLAEQIAEAEQAGDWKTARRLKSAQLAAASNDQ